ncbi:PPE domain-containing protein [Mycobacterium gastri]|uniref:PPE domain-containing protein n=1 Tax=Mycobacterium gastri TaxID=1777 RepID=UPI00111C8631|nr:PPE domain-containing protein [Mycobacterium gastri]
MVHPWSAFSPEANYAALASGSGPASTLAYADTLSAQAAQVRAVVAASAASGAATYGTGWQGAGATASAVTHGVLDAQHELLAAALVDKASHVVAAAGAHQSALASMVTAQEAGANRVDEAAAQQLNPLVWGALTPKIVALNVEYYGQMWPHNAAAGAAYGVALRAAAAAIMVPFPPAVPGASLAAAAVGLAEAGAISAAGATLRASEQAAHAVLTPAAAAPQGGAGARGGAAPLAGSAVPSAAPNAASVAGTPTAAQTVHPAPQAAVGMFARISPAGVVGAPTAAPPAGEGPASAQLAEALQSRAGALTPPGSELGPGGVSGYPGAGFTSYVRPTGDGFAPPPIERAGSSAPAGMLNAAALGGPVTTPSLTAPMQPLAYVHPQPPQPGGLSLAPQPPLLDPGDIAHTLSSPPPPQSPAPPLPAPQPDAPPGGPPGPATGSGGPSGSGGPGAQMLGFGAGPAPQAPPSPIPLAPQPPPPPPPSPSPGKPPLGPPPIPPWASPPPPASLQATRDAYNKLTYDIDHHNLNPPNPADWNAVNAYNQEAWYYNSLKAQLERQLDTANVQYTPAKDAARADIPYWTQPAPQQPHAPSPDPSTPTGQRGGPMDVRPGTNAPTTIDGTSFSGHALDEMQSDGIPVSVVQNTLRNGLSAPSIGGTTVFFDPVNNVSVVQAASGKIVTVSFGDLRR